MENRREAVKERALAVVEQANALVIITNEDYRAAGEFLIGIKAIRKEIGEVFDPIIEKAFSTHKEAVRQKKEAEAPLLKAESIIKPRIAEYTAEQERRRRIEEERLFREAEKKAEEERLIRAEEAERAGKKEEAEAILDEVDFVPPPVVPKMDRLAGISIRKTWKYQITNELIIPREFLAVDTVKLGQYARSMKERANVLGVIFFAEDSVASEAR